MLAAGINHHVARDQGLEGRSDMSKDELRVALGTR
jgi:hypothetical protein